MKTDYLTVPECACAVGRGTKTIERAIYGGELPAEKDLLGRIMVHRQALETWAASRRYPLVVSYAAEPTDLADLVDTLDAMLAAKKEQHA